VSNPLRMTALVISALAVLSASGCQTEDGSLAEAGPGLTCLRPSQINGWKLLGPERVIVDTGPTKYWQLDLMAPCPQFDWTTSLGFAVGDRIHRASIVCPARPEELTVLMPVGRNLLRCPVKALRQLTAAEIAALPPEARP
jgi:hypothetical protein